KRALLEGNMPRAEELIEQIWKARRQVPEILTRRIIEGRAQVPLFSFEILGTLAGARTPTYLKRIAQEPGVSDIVRFGAQRRLGWPERGEAKRRLAFLKSLKDPEGTLVAAVEQAATIWPPQSEILQEVLGYLAVLPADQRGALIERVAKELGAQADWLLHGALHMHHPETQRLILRELVKLRDPGSAGPIERLRQTTRDPGVRIEATAAVERLRMQEINRRRPKAPGPFPPAGTAHMSMIDGSGTQVIIARRDWGTGHFLLVDILYNDTVGVKDAFGTSHAPAEEIEDIVSELEEQGVQMVEVDLAAVRGALKAALEVNAAAGTSIPPAFELWEPLVHDSYPSRPDEPVTVPDLDDTRYVNRRDLLRSSDSLADQRFLDSWTFDPEETVAAMNEAPQPSGGRLTDRQYRPMIRRLFDEKMCALTRNRLRRQAWLLDKAGDEEARDLALAVAAELAGGPKPELSKLPFLRAIVDRSVDGVLAEALHARLEALDLDGMED
ncbi:MAG: hypothetical protein M1531_11640, partial [Chloroflexi bacterium]|nr:hypothetical protein [Chloroflexota bacterium]